ncbi:MAG: 5-methylcytosine restriction system specificity protein McrC, partial [Flavobacterium sp.]
SLNLNCNFYLHIHSEKMLALLFDMNMLWEEYILVRLKQVAQQKNVQVYGQNSKRFWKTISIRPDLVIEHGEGKHKQVFVIDTKWKNIDYSEPSTHDLRQMYVYNEYWGSLKAMLLYPSNITSIQNNTDFIAFEDNRNSVTNHACSLGKISIFKEDTDVLNDQIGVDILGWFIGSTFD